MIANQIMLEKNKTVCCELKIPTIFSARRWPKRTIKVKTGSCVWCQWWLGLGRWILRYPVYREHCQDMTTFTKYNNYITTYTNHHYINIWTTPVMSRNYVDVKRHHHHVVSRGPPLLYIINNEYYYNFTKERISGLVCS